MKLLLIDNYDSFTYNIVELLRQCNVHTITIVKNDEVTIAIAKQYTHIIISPGPKVPKESGTILCIIKELYTTHSILGICLGHQAIAEAFGATLHNFEHPKHGCIETIETEKEILYNSLPKNFNVGLYHSWYVSSNNFPQELQITAKTKEGIIMSLKHKNYKVWGVQFHPESYMTEYGKEIMLHWLQQ